MRSQNLLCVLIRAWAALSLMFLTSIATPHALAAEDPGPPGATCPPVPLTRAEHAEIFAALQAGPEPTEAPERTFSDATLVAAVRRYAIVQLGLRITPAKVDRLWAIQSAPRDIEAEFAAARANNRLAAWLADLPPPHAGYRRLEGERCRYSAIVESGGWETITSGPALKPGDASDRVEALRRRLTTEGYAIGPSPDPRALDSNLVDALKTFQARHSIDADGKLGPETVRALNVPAEDRLRQIEANLERWRWLPHRLPADRIEVDVGQQTATLFEGGLERLSMRVIVGDPAHKTPMFASRVESVVFNPPWNVPTSIARNEIWPRVARDPTYLARHDMTSTPAGIVQRPGPRNSLGRLKFDFDSPFGVYLHDTPARSLFQRRDRTLSHGCVRLEDARKLAEALLEGQGWSPKDVAAAIEVGATRRVALKTPVSLFVVYRTAIVGTEGWTIFGPDPYRWDDALLSALAKGQRTIDEARSESECARIAAR
jgi:murein L,D-transpeptidase YcbB/YkuD